MAYKFPEDEPDHSEDSYSNDEPGHSDNNSLCIEYDKLKKATHDFYQKVLDVETIGLDRLQEYLRKLPEDTYPNYTSKKRETILEHVARSFKPPKPILFVDFTEENREVLKEQLTNVVTNLSHKKLSGKSEDEITRILKNIYDKNKKDKIYNIDDFCKNYFKRNKTVKAQFTSLHLKTQIRWMETKIDGVPKKNNNQEQKLYWNSEAKTRKVYLRENISTTLKLHKSIPVKPDPLVFMPPIYVKVKGASESSKPWMCYTYNPQSENSEIVSRFGHERVQFPDWITDEEPRRITHTHSKNQIGLWSFLHDGSICSFKDGDSSALSAKYAIYYYVVYEKDTEIDYSKDSKKPIDRPSPFQIYVGYAIKGIVERWNRRTSQCKKEAEPVEHCRTDEDKMQLVDTMLALAYLKNYESALFLIYTYESDADEEKKISDMKKKEADIQYLHKATSMSYGLNQRQEQKKRVKDEHGPQINTLTAMDKTNKFKNAKATLKNYSCLA